MQDTELRFPSLQNMMAFKQQSQVQALRIDTNEKSLTGRFTEGEVALAVSAFKAIVFSRQQITTV